MNFANLSITILADFTSDMESTSQLMREAFETQALGIQSEELFLKNKF